METKQFITLTIGLVIGILLISGVVAPVIADVSSDSGGNGAEYVNEYSWEDRYSRAKDGYAISYYIVDHGENYGNYHISNQPDTVENRDIYEIGNALIVYRSFENLGSMEYPDPCVWIDLNPSGPNGEDVFWIQIEGEYVLYSSLTFEGHVLKGVLFTSGTEETIFDDVILYSNPFEGDYINVIDNEGAVNIPLTSYALESTVFMAVFHVDPNWATVYVEGSAISNEVFANEGVSYEGTADVSIIDNSITSISVNVEGTSYTIPTEGDYDDNIMRWDSLFLPESVTSSGSSGISSTVSTVLSVIPLVLTVGLVIGAIGFLRMKN